VIVERRFAQRIRHGCDTPRRRRCLRGPVVQARLMKA
jgi:hypothetical protein